MVFNKKGYISSSKLMKMIAINIFSYNAAKKKLPEESLKKYHFREQKHENQQLRFCFYFFANMNKSFLDTPPKNLNLCFGALHVMLEWMKSNWKEIQSVSQCDDQVEKDFVFSLDTLCSLLNLCFSFQDESVLYDESKEENENSEFFGFFPFLDLFSQENSLNLDLGNVSQQQLYLQRKKNIIAFMDHTASKRITKKDQLYCLIENNSKSTVSLLLELSDESGEEEENSDEEIIFFSNSKNSEPQQEKNGSSTVQENNLLFNKASNDNKNNTFYNGNKQPPHPPQSSLPSNPSNFNLPSSQKTLHLFPFGNNVHGNTNNENVMSNNSSTNNNNQNLFSNNFGSNNNKNQFQNNFSQFSNKNPTSNNSNNSNFSNNNSFNNSNNTGNFTSNLNANQTNKVDNNINGNLYNLQYSFFPSSMGFTSQQHSSSIQNNSPFNILSIYSNQQSNTSFSNHNPSPSFLNQNSQKDNNNNGNSTVNNSQIGQQERSLLFPFFTSNQNFSKSHPSSWSPSLHNINPNTSGDNVDEDRPPGF